MSCFKDEYTDWMNFAGIARQRETVLPSLSRDVMSLVLVSNALKASASSEIR